jgi:L-threonylcarbamoyladenylate synthase
VKIVQPDEAGLALAAEALHAGEVVAYPTETVYGLAVDPFSEQAIQKLFGVKGRAENNPILLIVADTDQLAAVVQTVSDKATAYMNAFWPGPLSLLFPKADGLPEALTAGSPKICIRCSASDTARALCVAFGHPITSSSANVSGQPPATSLEELSLPGIAITIDGGPCTSQPPSTIFDPDTYTILREGAITQEMLGDIR